MSIVSPQKVSGTLTTAALAYTIFSDNQTRAVAIAASAAGVLATPNEGQANVRLATSAIGGAALAWRFSSDNTPGKTLVGFAVAATAALFLGQYVLAQKLTSKPEEVEMIPSVLQTIYNTPYVRAVTHQVLQTVPVSAVTGPQTVNATAAAQQLQREPVGNRVG